LRDILKDNKSNKALKIGTNIILILLIIGAIQMFYDEDFTNDHFGGLFMMVFFAIKIVSSFLISLKEGDKKAVFIDLGLVVLCVLLLIVTS
jgi:Ca2+/Na+ antiporter